MSDRRVVNFLAAALPAVMLLLGAAQAQTQGEWKAPAADGAPWPHSGTGLEFPQLISGYRLAGELKFADGGSMLRYENTEARARADVFIFRATASTKSQEDRHRLILRELDIALEDLRSMAKEGRYKNVVAAEVTGREIPMWRQEPLPLGIRTVDAVRLGGSAQEAKVRLWLGATVLGEHMLTIRHMRPIETGDEGQGDMEAFLGGVFQAIKDPSLRREVARQVDAYLADPFSAESDQAAAAVLAYLERTPLLPVHVPEHPISGWLQRCEAVAPGTEQHLLRAFMLGSAKAALAGKPPAECVDAGATQFARVYRRLVEKHPGIALPDMQPFIAAAESGMGAKWLRGRK